MTYFRSKVNTNIFLSRLQKKKKTFHNLPQREPRYKFISFDRRRNPTQKMLQQTKTKPKKLQIIFMGIVVYNQAGLEVTDKT